MAAKKSDKSGAKVRKNKRRAAGGAVAKRTRWPPWLVATILIVLAALAVWRFLSPTDDVEIVEVIVPETLSGEGQTGARSFATNCQGCHGVNATGTDKGPPLVHDIYNPGHHGDMAFVTAVRFGTRQHHWPYGDMPAQPNVADDEIRAIIRFIRELQQANGIETKPHTM